MLLHIILLAAIQKELIMHMYYKRGYFAIGGEYLVIPLMPLIVKLYTETKKELQYEKTREDK